MLAPAHQRLMRAVKHAFQTSAKAFLVCLYVVVQLQDPLDARREHMTYSAFSLEQPRL